MFNIWKKEHWILYMCKIVAVECMATFQKYFFEMLPCILLPISCTYIEFDEFSCSFFQILNISLLFIAIDREFSLQKERDKEPFRYKARAKLTVFVQHTWRFQRILRLEKFLWINVIIILGMTMKCATFEFLKKWGCLSQ